MEVVLEEEAVYYHYRQEGVDEFLRARSTKVEHTIDDWVVYTIKEGLEVEVDIFVDSTGIREDPFKLRS